MRTLTKCPPKAPLRVLCLDGGGAKGFYTLVINVKTAKALGLEVPPLLLAIADSS